MPKRSTLEEAGRDASPSPERQFAEEFGVVGVPSGSVPAPRQPALGLYPSALDAQRTIGLCLGTLRIGSAARRI